MGQDDGSYIAAAIAQPLQLLWQGLVGSLSVLVFVEDQAHETAIVLAVPMRLIRTDSGIDQDQTFRRMLQQIGVDGDPDEVTFVGNEPKERAEPLPTGQAAIELAIGHFGSPEQQRI